MRIVPILLILIGLQSNVVGQELKFVDVPGKKKIELHYGGKLLTAFCFFDSTEKPILFPINTVSGVTITRGYPIAPRPGERTDHPHHTGLWLNYESVNGLDFWNNSFAIPQEKKSRYGSIRHQYVLGRQATGKKAELTALANWVDHTGKVLLEEVTVFYFEVRDNALIIDRSSNLHAKVDTVAFRDVKDGLLGLRVARELELPSTQEDKFVDASGNITTVAKASSVGVTGDYFNREGLRGDAVWGKRSQWTVLTGKKDNETVSIGMIDHPINHGYPAYWHARGYGLFAVNPLGQKIFSNGKEALNLKLKKNEQATFFYRIVILSGEQMTPQLMDAFMDDFTKPKK